MSALARYFVSKGCTVSGYDKTKTVLTEALSDLGINIHYEDNTGLIDTKADVVVYTPAIPASHSELTYYTENGYEVVIDKPKETTDVKDSPQEHTVG